MVNATVVIAEIASHPVLWQLYNKMLGLHPAKPVDNEYLVYYNVYENIVFCNRRIVIKRKRIKGKNKDQAILELRNT